MGLFSISLGRPKDYDEMLNKIALGSFATCTVCLKVLANANPLISELLNKGNWKLDFYGIENIPFLYITIPLIVAVLFRSVKFHDMISDIFRLREKFDILEILIPMLGELNLSVNYERLSKIKKNRDHFMASVFYKYAGSQNPRIEKHIIYSALDKWTWFWILIESTFLFLVTSIILCFSHSYSEAVLFSFLSILGIILFSFSSHICSGIAKVEVIEILKTKKNREEITKEFNAL